MLLNIFFFQSLIRSKARANVNLALDPSMNLPAASTPRPLKQATPKMRPSSAPGTRMEAQIAHLSAGETEHLNKPKEVFIPENVIPPEDPETERIRQELLATDVKEVTKEDLMNSNLF